MASATSPKARPSASIGGVSTSPARSATPSTQRSALPIAASAPSLANAAWARVISSRIRAADCIRRRRLSSASSSPGCGASLSSSATAWRKNSSSAATWARAVCAASRAVCACRNARHWWRVASTRGSSWPNVSSRRRCPRASSSPRSSCWPCSSTKVSDNCRSTSPEQRRSFTHAVLRPSTVLTRRSNKLSSSGKPASRNTARAG